MILNYLISIFFGTLSGVLAIIGLTVLVSDTAPPPWATLLGTAAASVVAAYAIAQTNGRILNQVRRGFLVSSVAAYLLIPCFAFQAIEKAEGVPQLLGQLIAKGIEMGCALGLVVVFLSGYGMTRLVEIERIEEEKFSKEKLLSLPWLKIAKATAAALASVLGIYLIREGLK